MERSGRRVVTRLLVAVQGVARRETRSAWSWRLGSCAAVVTCVPAANVVTRMAVTAVERVAVERVAAVLVPARVGAAVVMKVATGRVQSEDAGRARARGGG